MNIGFRKPVPSVGKYITKFKQHKSTTGHYGKNHSTLHIGWIKALNTGKQDTDSGPQIEKPFHNLPKEES